MRAEIAELDMWVCNHRHCTEMATQITATFDQGHLEVTCNKTFWKTIFYLWCSAFYHVYEWVQIRKVNYRFEEMILRCILWNKTRYGPMHAIIYLSTSRPLEIIAITTGLIYTSMGPALQKISITQVIDDLGGGRFAGWELKWYTALVSLFWPGCHLHFL